MTQQNPPTVRGFVIERQDGQAQLPGSLHTNRKLSQWVSLQTPGQIEILTGKAELGQGSPIMIIMKTEMGQGVDYMMGSHKWHGVAPNDQQLQDALAQLEETLGDY